MTRLLLALVVLSGLLAGCGVRGPPEAPAGVKKTNEPIVLDPLIKGSG
jgi:predicted small lipoprotein YifL